jgi:hypothetical protein
MRGGMPKTLTERDLRRIRAFFASLKPIVQPLAITPKPESNSPSESRPKPTAHDLERLYKYLCQHGGRNEALFRTSLYARDTGWLETETQTSLAFLHIKQESSNSKEAPTHRQREAQKTIQSAFSRPARPTKSRARLLGSQLSNSVREALVQNKMTFVIRTHEALLAKGVHPGQIISTNQAIELLKGIVGRDSVLSALKAKHAGQPLFPPVNPHYRVATDHSQ